VRIVAKTGGTLFELLQARFPEASKTTIRQMLRHRRVTLDGQVVSRADSPVQAGQVVEVAPVRGTMAAELPGRGRSAAAVGRGNAAAAPRRGSTAAPPGRVLFRDAHLLAVEKPAGILSVARGPTGDDTFYRRLNDYVRASSGGRERIFIVHRLDREASGIMLFALSPEIQASFQRAWTTTEKRYWALVEGRPPEKAGTIQSWLRENRAHKVYSAPKGPEAKLAVTHYRVRRTDPACSLLEVQIETGRKNQIRVHLSELGCPIVGDRKYGARTNPIRRLGLHAYLLAFMHPVSGERIRLRLALPGAFRRG